MYKTKKTNFISIINNNVNLECGSMVWCLPSMNKAPEFIQTQIEEWKKN